MQLNDDMGQIWYLTPRGFGTNAEFYEAHFQTPLVLPVGSGLNVEIRTNGTEFIRVNLIGRVVTL